VTDPSASPPPDARIGTGQSIALGCGGFVAFFVLAAFLAGAMSEGGAAAIVTLLGVVALLVWGVVKARRSDPHTRAVVVRLAIGFVVALLLFGGCLALIANANFH